MATNARAQDKRVSIAPYFTVPLENMAKFKALFRDFYKCVDNEPNCFYYGFTVDEKSGVVFNRECYDSAEGLIKHIENTADVGAQAGALCSDVRLEIHAPKEEAAKLEAIAKDINAQIFVMDEDGFVNNNMETGKPDTSVSIHPYFKVSEEKWDAFVATHPEYYKLVKANEPDCHMYCFSHNKEAGIVFNRESYKNAEALLNHIENTKPANEIADGLFESVDLEIHGPAAELEKLESVAKEIGARVFVADADSRVYKQ